MSVPAAMPDRVTLLGYRKLLPLLAVAVAYVLCKFKPARLRRAMQMLRRGARPADIDQARAARASVVAVSVACAGQGCLQRSIATAVLCRMRGTWPTWCTGVRTSPFQAHAWVQVDDQLIDEPQPNGYYIPTMVIPPE